jgi:hypothetical protein
MLAGAPPVVVFLKSSLTKCTDLGRKPMLASMPNAHLCSAQPADLLPTGRVIFQLPTDQVLDLSI